MNKERIVSSIPRAAEAEENVESTCPYHKSSQSSSGNWIYPSPQMFWDAMRRKGSLPDHLKDASRPQTQEELDWIVTIHNIVNEQCWQEICKWERFRVEGCINQQPPPVVNVSLQRFLGRPNDLSPRAWFNSTIRGTRKPFDRHDWFIRLPDGSIRRYVIDFYPAKGDGVAGAFHLDVRPAVDSLDSAFLRFCRFFCNKNASPCLFMQPEHKCTPDCETIHREIFKKIFTILVNGREKITEKATDSWFGLVTPTALTRKDELYKSFLFGNQEKKFQVGIFLQNSDNQFILNYEHPRSGQKIPLETPKILLELWTITFDPKVREGGDELLMTKLYKVVSYFARSLWSIQRLLPTHALANKGMKIVAEVDESCELQVDSIRESFIAHPPDESSTILEKLEAVQVGLLSSLHGDVNISVNFRTDCAFSLSPKSTAIEVPKNTQLPGHEIKIENSPDWVDMSAQFSSSRTRREPKSVSYRPVVVPAVSDVGRSQELADFIKFFEKPPLVRWMPRTEMPTLSAIMKRLERARADKIVMDRWLEEVELAQEQSRDALDFSEFVDSME